MIGIRLYMLQRLTALVMAPLAVGHLAVMIYAIQGGLSAAEILGRTQGSFAWTLFYGSFVLAVSVHAAIGLRVILAETTSLASRRVLDAFTVSVGIGLLAMGLSAVYGVTAS